MAEQFVESYTIGVSDVSRFDKEPFFIVSRISAEARIVVVVIEIRIIAVSVRLLNEPFSKFVCMLMDSIYHLRKYRSIVYILNTNIVRCCKSCIFESLFIANTINIVSVLSKNVIVVGI